MTTRRRLIFVNLAVMLAALAILWLVIASFGNYVLDQQVNQQLLAWTALEQPAVEGLFEPHDASNDDQNEHGSDTNESDDTGAGSATTAPTGGVCSATPATSATPTTSEPTETQCFYTPSSPNVFSVTVNTKRSIVADNINVQRFGLPSWSPVIAALTGKTKGTFTTTAYGGHSYRLYTVPIVVKGKVVGAIQSGVSLDQRNQQEGYLLLTLLVVMLTVLALVVGSSVLLTGRALIPARQAFVRQRQFAAAASHELRTPLALIRSQAELTLGELRDLKDRAERRRELWAGVSKPSAPMGANFGTRLSLIAPQQMAEAPTATNTANAADAAVMATDVEEIIAEVDFMGRMVSDLLLLARDEREAYNLTHARLNLGSLVAEATAKVRPLAQTNQLTLIGPQHDRNLEVLGDADRLRQLLFILLDNAIRYTPRGGTITVETHVREHSHLLGVGGASHRTVTLIVRDTGVGIAPEHIPHIFEPFYRPQNGRKASPNGDKTAMVSPEDANGTGLGLALAAWIAHAHGGDIRVESVVSKGSVFTVTLPLAEKDDATVR